MQLHRLSVSRGGAAAALLLAFALSTALQLAAQSGPPLDTACPAYPAAMRLRDQTALARMQRVNRLQRRVPLDYDGSQDVNFIDTQLFSRMYQDGVPAAAPAADAEFLRRVTLDLTGHIPAIQQVLDYTSSTDANKSDALIDRLLASNEFIDYWTLWFGNT